MGVGGTAACHNQPLFPASPPPRPAPCGPLLRTLWSQCQHSVKWARGRMNSPLERAVRPLVQAGPAGWTAFRARQQLAGSPVPCGGERRPLRRTGAGRGTGASVGQETLLPSPPCALLGSEASLGRGTPGGEVPGQGNAERGPTSPPPCHPPGFRSGLSGQWPRALTGALGQSALHFVARRPRAQLPGERAARADIVEARGLEGCGTKGEG